MIIGVITLPAASGFLAIPSSADAAARPWPKAPQKQPDPYQGLLPKQDPLSKRYKLPLRLGAVLLLQPSKPQGRQELQVQLQRFSSTYLPPVNEIPLSLVQDRQSTKVKKQMLE